jgi:hypothetical protein
MIPFSERCEKITSLLSEIDTSTLSDIRLLSRFLNEAVECFTQKLTISSIIVSSTTIERTLFYEKIRTTPPKAGETMRRPTLGGLFKHFLEWGVLLDTLLDYEERLDIQLRIERGRSKKTIEKRISKVKFVETRNLFSHGKELLLSIHLSHLLPHNGEALSKYSIDFTEWTNPNIETVAFVHLTKTLDFIKAYSVHLKKSKD